MDLTTLAVGDALPERIFTATNVSLFLYNASVWNSHRIHYDETYTKQEEGHPEIVIDGPLQGDWLSQCALNWLGHAGHMTRFSYSNRRAAYLGEALTTGGVVTAVDVLARKVEVELFVKNQAGDIITPGDATLLFD
ncbi:MAG: hydroxyacyl-ACP dehydratase HTD2-like protein with hotdog domain [Candidatus Azotimanducaceae bacterium]|jgi:hydroxyacyl-ACP dehydratase HTD2-like protein with hotdog domain